MNIITKLCSLIVRHAVQDPRCAAIVADVVVRSDKLECYVENTVTDMIEHEIEDHAREYDHSSERDIEDMIENGLRDLKVDAGDIDDLEDAVLGSIKTLVREGELKGVALS